MSHDVISLPSLDPATSTGTVMCWLVADGDAVEGGDVVAEVRVGRVETDIVADSSGWLQHSVSASTPLAVGSAMARLVGGDWSLSAAAGQDIPSGAISVIDATMASENPTAASSVGHRLCEFSLRPGVAAAQIISAVNAVVAPRVGVVRARPTEVASVDFPPLPPGCLVAVGVGAITDRVTVVNSSGGASIGIRPTVAVGLTYTASEEAETVARLTAEALRSL